MSDLAYREHALTFDAGDARLVAIVTTPTCDMRSKLGVLVVVGGPQYRVGSHRQFVHLARALATRGLTAMRFDCAGMGDSSGATTAFTNRDRDIRAAIDTFIATAPELVGIALWGLCDAASAALLYAPQDRRVTKLVLLNPWVRSEAGLARTHLKHYYAARLSDRTFWRHLLRGEVGIGRALREFAATVMRARASKAPEHRLTFQTRMARGWKKFSGDILLICSGDDLTAREFIDHAASDAEWRGVLEQARVARCDLSDADHTFSRAPWRDQVATWTADWLLGTRGSDEVRTRATREAA